MTRRQRSANQGFTLLELLVAMTLLAVLSAILFGGLRFGMRVWEGGSQTLEALEETHAVQNALRRMIGNARPPRPTGTFDPSRPIFDGSSTGVVFVGLRPSPVMIGALYWLRVMPVRDGDAVHLLMSWSFRDSDDSDQDPFATATHKVLLENIEAIEMEYFGPTDEEFEPVWVPYWQSADRLPLLVRIQIVFPPRDNRVWPELVIAVRNSDRLY